MAGGHGATIPKSVEYVCPNCSMETRHRVLAGRFVIKKGSVILKSTIKCSNCGYVYNTEIRQSREIEVRTVISTGQESELGRIYMLPDDVVAVDDIISGPEGIPLRVRAIESGGRRVKRCAARDIETLWAVNYDRVRVKVSIHNKSRTTSKTLSVPMDEYFAVGDEIEVDGKMCVISRIKTRDKVVYVGEGAEAADIVRIYAKNIKNYQGA